MCYHASRRWLPLIVATIAGLSTPLTARSAPVTFVKLTDATGGSPALTAVYRADLSSVGITNLFSITITDNSFGLGGASSQFSGFDLDAIILSTTSVDSATEAAGLAGLAGFDYSPTGTFFTPGAQRPPVDPKLFGTGPGGTTVDNSVATLGLFDADATTAIPGAFGYVSMGDGGTLSFNLTSAIPTDGLFLYIGEVGDNGEVAAGNVVVSDQPISPIPEPSAVILFGVGGALICMLAARRQRANR
jgi:hypothetical protein